MLSEDNDKKREKPWEGARDAEEIELGRRNVWWWGIILFQWVGEDLALARHRRCGGKNARHIFVDENCGGIILGQCQTIPKLLTKHPPKQTWQA